MQIDPEATLRCYAVEVEVAGTLYTIPGLPAQPWIEALHGSWPDIVPGMLTGDLDDLKDAIIAETIPGDECRRAAQSAVEAVAGCPWWTASRLAHTAGEEIGAELLLAGVDPERVPLARWLLAAYRIATRHAEPIAIAQLDAVLDAPPEGLVVQEWAGDDSANLAAFGAAMASTAGRNRGRS